MREIRGAKIGMIFQEPMTALNPLHTIGRQLDEVLRIHTALGKAARRARVLELIDNVHLPDPGRIIRSYPASIERRPAPARDDRDGAAAQSAAVDRRRADHGARRHHPGADPLSDPRIAARARHVGAVHHPRFRRRRRYRRRGRGAATRHTGRTRHRRRRARRAQPSLHQGPDRGGAEARAAGGAAREHTAVHRRGARRRQDLWHHAACSAAGSRWR